MRGVSRGVERFLLERGERVVRVPPKLMAGARKSARTYGKSDSIDALAIARAALAHPELPNAAQDDAARDLQLLASHREALVRQRSEAQDRLRWLLHDIDPDLRVRPARWIVRSGLIASLGVWHASSRRSGCGSRATWCVVVAR